MSKLRARIEARQDRRLEIAKGNGNWREFIVAIFFVFVSMDVLPRATILRVFA